MIRPNPYNLDQDEPERLRRQQLLQESSRRQIIGLKLIRRLQQLQQQQLRPPPSPPLVEADLESDYSRLTAFLEADCSFFSPWNWSPNYAPQDHHGDNSKINIAGRNQRKRMMFLLGSFFSHDHQDLKNTARRREG